MSPRFEKIIILTLLLSTILQTYGWGKYDFSFILTSVLSIIFLVKTRFKNTLPKILLYYFLYRLLIHEISASEMSSLMPLGILKSLFAFIMFFGITNYNFFIKSYRKIAIICIFFFFIQECMYIALGYRISGVFEQLPLSLSVDDVSSFYEKMSEKERSSSFFSEPSHFAQFLLPLLCIELFSKSKNYFIISMIIITLMLLMSGNAIIGMVTIALMYLSYILKKYNRTTGIVLVTFLLSMLMVIGLFYADSTKGQEMMERSYQLSSNSVDVKGGGQSGFLRIYRGYGVFEEFGTYQKLFGNDNESYFISKARQSSVSMFFKEDDTYINTFQSFLIFTGIVGVCFFIFIFIHIWRLSDFTGKSVLITFYALSFVSALYLTDSMALYLLIPWMSRRELLHSL